MGCFPVSFIGTRGLLLNPNQLTSGQASLIAITCLLRFSQIPCVWNHHHHAQPKETLLLYVLKFSSLVIYFRSTNYCFFCGLGSNSLFLNLLEPLQFLTGPCLGVCQNMTQFPSFLFLNSHFLIFLFFSLLFFSFSEVWKDTFNNFQGRTFQP